MTGIKCINCGESDLRVGTVRLSGQVRGETYTVEMEGLVCPNCGYQTIEGTAMPEFGRLLADEYRKKHGLLTSIEIRARRKALGMNQQEFADYVDSGIASVKRWEMGKIQDEHSNQRIIERTDAAISSARGYAWTFTGVTTTLRRGSSCSPFITATGITPEQSSLFQNCFDDAMKMYQCGHFNQTNTRATVLDFPDHQTVPAFIDDRLSHKKERRSHVRR